MMIFTKKAKLAYFTLILTGIIFSAHAKETKLIPEVSSKIGDSAAQNIINYEKVFCYSIAPRPQNYKGYTLNGFAIKGFCGIINDEVSNLTIKELFNNRSAIDFNQNEKCTIEPKVMIRFIRGIDYTDVLLSSPCHSFAVFYGGKATAFNAKPGAKIIDAIVTPLTKNKLEFASPPLFNQLIPIGVARTPEQKMLIKQKNAPLRNWQQKTNTSAPQNKSTGGWGNINLDI